MVLGRAGAYSNEHTEINWYVIKLGIYFYSHKNNLMRKGKLSIV